MLVWFGGVTFGESISVLAFLGGVLWIVYVVFFRQQLSIRIESPVFSERARLLVKNREEFTVLHGELRIDSGNWSGPYWEPEVLEEIWLDGERCEVAPKILRNPVYVGRGGVVAIGICDSNGIKEGGSCSVTLKRGQHSNKVTSGESLAWLPKSQSPPRKWIDLVVTPSPPGKPIKLTFELETNEKAQVRLIRSGSDDLVTR